MHLTHSVLVYFSSVLRLFVVYFCFVSLVLAGRRLWRAKMKWKTMRKMCVTSISVSPVLQYFAVRLLFQKVKQRIGGETRKFCHHLNFCWSNGFEVAIRIIFVFDGLPYRGLFSYRSDHHKLYLVAVLRAFTGKLYVFEFISGKQQWQATIPIKCTIWHLFSDSFSSHSNDASILLRFQVNFLVKRFAFANNWKNLGKWWLIFIIGQSVITPSGSIRPNCHFARVTVCQTNILRQHRFILFSKL